MLQCTTCGTSAADDAGKCSRCGAELIATAGNGAFAAAAGAAGDETVVMPPSETSRPRTASSAVSRLTTTSIPDEGRFIPGTLIAGRYRVIALLGRGGMGEVYRATDLTLGQSVALKFLPDEAAGNMRLLERFHNEVRIARQVSHPNVCRVYDIGEFEGVPFMSMEYVDGEDLAGLLQRIGRLPSDKALEITRKLCAGVAAAHERGIIHRDLKPQNVMLNKRGEVVIMDFGLAGVADELQGAEVRNGTPAYMAPEQLRGDSVTAHSDIYSLGLMVYELYTGKRPFSEARSAADLLRLEESTRPPTITSVAPEVDPAVEKVIARCLAPDPAQRPATALAIAAALPGGDPLAAALAAGETPSPELVAASGHREGFALRYAAPCLAFVLLAVLAFPFVGRSISLLAGTPLEYEPAVLQQKSRDIASSFGYPARPLDSKAWLQVNNDVIGWLDKHRANAPWRQVMTAVPPVELIYRQSPDYLVADADGAITTDRPAFTLPGMITMVVDSRGRLRRFSAIAPRYDDKSPPAPVDPAVVFRAANLVLSQFREASPQYAPPLAFDNRRAWSGNYPGIANLPVTIELATWRGVPTSFFIHWPWTKPPQPSQSASSPGQLAGSLFTVLFLATGLFWSCLLARRNVRQGRGDRRGAFRLATTAFILYCITWLARIHIVPRFDMLDFAFSNLGLGLLLASIFWLVYMALEPAVRARWPHTLITWNRALAGRLGDPRVGSHILIGVTAGTVLICLFIWRSWWSVASGHAPNGGEDDLSILMGVKPLLARIANYMFGGLLSGAIIFLLLSGLRALLRRDWIAAVAAAVLMTLEEGNVRNSSNLAFDIPLYMGLFVIFAFILLRIGLIPAVVALFVLNISGLAPISGDFGAWYNWVTVVLLGLVAGIAIFGFWRSQSAPARESTAPI